MTKFEILELINQNPVMSLATCENNQPHVRGILMYKADEEGIWFHTGNTKDLYRQLVANPKAEVCFNCGKYQIRVEGEFTLVNDMAKKEEIVAHPSRKFLQPWRQSQGDEKFFNFLQVFVMKNGKAHVWTMEDNFKPKEYIQL